MTSNRLELLGVINGLSSLTERCMVAVITDSRYIVDAINKLWLRSWKRNGWVRSDGSLKNIVLERQRYDEVIAALDNALRHLHSCRAGLVHLCEHHDYCMDCAGGEYSGARPFLALRAKARPA